MIWSFSEGRLFTKCQRQWYFGKRLASATAKDPLRREAYLLSKLSSIHAWRGKIVDQVLAENDPRTKAWLDAFRRIQLLISNHFTKQIIELEAARTTNTIRAGVADSYQSWQCRWAEEFFCDLFGLFSVGPAFAWSHLHLHAVRGRNAYQLPRRFSTHPADSPRMAIMLDALSLLNQGTVASQIEAKWKALLSVAGQSEPQEYHRYYPRPLLKKCVEEAIEGFTGMGCKPWAASDKSAIRNTLNEAWNRFWTAPLSFAAWEKEVTEALIPT